MVNINSVCANASRINLSDYNLGKLTEVIPGTKVCKNLTQLDRNLFRAYIDLKPYMMGISPKEIAELNKLDGDDFVIGSYELLTKKLGLKQNIYPGLFMAEIPGDPKAMYTNMLNVIYVDPKKMEKMNKTEMFGLLRHELQHFIQNLKILRHEELGPKSININVAKFFETEKQKMMQICSQCSEYDILILAQNTENPQKFYQNVMNAKRCLVTNDMKGFDNVCGENTEDYRKQMINYRNNVIKEFGVIKKDSTLTPKIENDFKELNGMGYYNPDGTINSIMYASSKIEDEALNAQGAADFEYSQEPCFIQYAKKAIPRIFEDETTLKFVNDVLNK